MCFWYCSRTLLFVVAVFLYEYMQDKSSTSLAIISVLSIVIVLFIAIGNLEDAPVRKPFATGQAVSQSKSGEEEKPLPPFKQTDAEAPDPDSFVSNFPDFVESVAGLEDDPTEATAGPDTSMPVPAVEQKTADPQYADGSAPANAGALLGGINSEQLSRAGYRDFFVRPRPFNGMLFDLFNVSMLSYLDVVDKRVVLMKGGYETEILAVYQFSFRETEGAGEIYEYLKSDLKDELAVTLNETNQFGLASFFINFDPPKKSVFLVVKTKYNVYALSYPKDDKEGDGNFQLVSSLLSELP